MKDKKSVEKLFARLPYGIISGACAMVVFFATAGLVASYIGFSGIAAQTSDTVSFLEYGWQVALLAVDIVCAAVMIASFVAFILKGKKVIFADKKTEVEINENI